MSWSNWSFRFHNGILKHSNGGLFRMQEWCPTPGNIPHRAHCEKLGIKRSDLKWQKLFNRFAGEFSERHKMQQRFWWNLHRTEIYWRKMDESKNNNN